MNADRELEKFTAEALLVYGKYVVEQRAICDYRDGLKPVHRAILWSMYGLGIHHDKKFKKCAAPVGEALGNYHPHGDAAIFGALVGMVNAPLPLLEGYGDFGDQVSPSGHMRYVSCRLSKFTDTMLLDPQYLEVTPMEWNFSGDRKIPLYLPAKLPIALLVGNTGIAFGVASSTPSFDLRGVARLTCYALKVASKQFPKLKPEHLSPKLCAKHLAFKFKFGGTCISHSDDIEAFMADGKRTLLFTPDRTHDKKRYEITSACPGFQSESSIRATLEKIAEIKGVERVFDISDAGGSRYVALLQKSVKEQQAQEIFATIDDLLVKRKSYDMGFTIRAHDNVTFFRTNMPDFLLRWATWRLSLERKLLVSLHAKKKKEIAHWQLIAKAVPNLKVILRALESNNASAYLMQHMALTQEQAEVLLNLRVRQLERSDLPTLHRKIADGNTLLQSYVADHKQPCNRIITDISSLFNGAFP